MECLSKDEAAMRTSIAAFSALWHASGRLSESKFALALTRTSRQSPRYPYHLINQCFTFWIRSTLITRRNSVRFKHGSSRNQQAFSSKHVRILKRSAELTFRLHVG